MYLWASILVCQIVYFILIIVARCLCNNRDKTRRSKPENNMANDERCYLLTGLAGETLNNDDLKTKIGRALKGQQIEGKVRSVYTSFSGTEVGLTDWQPGDVMGFVRLTGANVKYREKIKVSDTMMLRSIPEDACAWTEVRLQKHVANMIPSVKKVLVELCEGLGIKLMLDQQSIWLLGDTLPINIARNHLNKEHSNTPIEFTFGGDGKPSDTQKVEKLKDMFSKYTMKEADIQMDYQSTPYLTLAFFLAKVTLPSNKAAFIIPTESCNEAKLIIQDLPPKTTLFSPTPVKEYCDKLQSNITALMQKYKPFCLTEPMPLDFRNVLENILEQMYKPTLFIKCRKRHWSCYIFPIQNVSEVKQFVKNYLKVNTYKPLDAWWADLPEEIMTNREPHQSHSAVTEHTKESEGDSKGDKPAEMIRPEVSGRKMRQPDDAKPPLPGKPIQISETKKPCTLIMDVGKNVQYLFAYHLKGIQQMESEHNVKITAEQEAICIRAANEDVAKEVGGKVKTKVQLANLHSSTLKAVFAPESTARGILILNCMEGTSVSVTGPRELVEAFEKVFQERSKTIGSTDQKTKTVEVKNPMKGKPDKPPNLDREGFGESEVQCDSLQGEATVHTGETKDKSMIGAGRKPPLHSGNRALSFEDDDRSTNSKATASTIPTEEKVNRLGSEGAKPEKERKPRERGLKQPPGRSQPRASPKRKATTGTEGMKTYESQKTGILVKVGVGNITKFQVDAIVNAANEDLDHIGGVAKAIADAAGPGFNEECQEVLRRRKKLNTGDVCVTGAGRMPAKKVLHAVGPAIDDYDQDEDAFDVLKETFSNCLTEAQHQNCASLAIPAVSSGVFGIPMNTVAEMARQALEDFFLSDTTSPVRMVIFTDVREEMVELFDKEMKTLVKKHILKQIAGSGSTV